MSRLLRVVKVGGSLLDWEDLPRALRRWLERQPRATNILIAGGGRLADVIRQADQRFQLDQEAAHWLCVSLMGVTARLLAQLVPAAQLIESYAELVGRTQRDEPGVIVFAVESFLRNDEPTLCGDRTTHNWQTTSDSVAARLAQVVAADELVLLKSVDLAAGHGRQLAAARGMVDPLFPRLAEGLAVRWVNLRSPDQAEAEL